MFKINKYYIWAIILGIIGIIGIIIAIIEMKKQDKSLLSPPPPPSYYGWSCGPGSTACKQDCIKGTLHCFNDKNICNSGHNSSCKLEL